MTSSVLVPAEWAPHRAMWTAWPSIEEMWPGTLSRARTEVAAMVKALAEGERVKVLACGDEALQSACAALDGVAEVIPFDYGDIWLRDTGPVFSRRVDGSLQAEIFKFNGWGEKYNLPHDKTVAARMTRLSGASRRYHDYILEGGSIESDGSGTIITTRQCLLNHNRNRHWDEEKATEALHESYGARKIIWLDEGLVNDHTDGHIDNLARFIAPGRVVCQSPHGNDDPNAHVLKSIESTLRSATDAEGRRLDIVTIPGPGRVVNDDDEPIAASHMNFIIGNKTVVMPIYNDRGVSALSALAKLFPTHKVVGLSAAAILTQGGAFHCITQQEPA
jgi:agmatine deiminase